MTPAQLFRHQLERFARRVEDRIVDAQLGIAHALQDELVRRTPADTGRARASWFMGVGRPASGVAPASEYSETAALRNARASRPARSTVRPGDALYISNNLPYIERLNNGSSEQAPAAFVQLTVQEVLAGAGGSPRGGA